MHAAALKYRLQSGCKRPFSIVCNICTQRYRKAFHIGNTQFVMYSTRNSSRDEIANVNFLYDDIVHILQNTIDSCINSATDRRGGYVLVRMFTKFSEITQCNGHYAVQGHSRSPILVPIESSYRTSY